ncbi:MAG: DNA polymerase domain-containing protein [bacterium]
MTSGPDFNPLVFGANRDEGLVAIEHESSRKTGEAMRLFFRRDGRIVETTESFHPFLWLREAAFMTGCPVKADLKPLKGGNPFNYLAVLEGWKDFDKAVGFLKKATGRNPSDSSAPFHVINDPVQQHLLCTGRTLFKGMRFRDVVRLQMDIETWSAPDFEFCNAERESDRIIAIAMADSTGWTQVLSGADLDEKSLIEAWAALICERDPDVIEGHNLFKFDLPYLFTRAGRHGVKLKIGRDGSTPATRPSRFNVAEQVIAYPRTKIFGRHVVDTYFLLQAYDMSHRALESFTLKDAAVHFGVAAPNRTYIDGGDIARTFDQDPATVMRYARDDILETRALSDLLSPSYFVQAQILPYSYQNICVRGSGAKIDSLMLREYLRQEHAIALPDEARPFAGGYTDIFLTGVARNVHHGDVRSLYPSLMLKDRIRPKSDELDIFLTLLRYLRDFRVDAKQRMQATASADERNHLDALQTTFKVLINSFYGYLGFSQARFSDFNAAERVAAEGRDLLKRMMAWLESHGAKPIEIDTDGIYFRPPEFKDPREVETFRHDFQAALPQGVEVEFDGEYAAMFSYKMKNYALLDAQGEITIKGAALKSRGLEPFQREYLKEWLRLTLEEKPDAIARLRRTYRDAIQNRHWPIRMLAKTETLQDAPSTYAAKIGDKARGRNAAYELAIRSGHDYRAGDQISHYVTGTRKSVSVFESAKMVSEWDPANRDENVAYYLAKLDALIRKFDAEGRTDESSQTEFQL